MKPGWLLDIDGVINAIGRDGDFTHHWPEDHWWDIYLGPDGPDYPFRAAEPVRDFIIEMHEVGVEIRWHTTWQEGAKVVSNYLDLPTFPVHPAPEFRDTRYREAWGRPLGWWKEPSVKRLLLSDDRPWIWTDDDIRLFIPNHQEGKDPFGPYEEAAIVIRDVIPANIGTSTHLFISPDEEYGLSPTHLALIRGFVNACLEDD